MAEPTPPSTPSPAQNAVLDRFADELYTLLTKRAASWGLLDIEVEQDEWLVEGELMFESGPDMGFSVNALTASCQYCVLPPDDDSEVVWLEELVAELHVLHASAADEVQELVMAVANGVLAARRPLLPRKDTPPAG